ncbi:MULTISPECIES: hydantoinase B/oxoprolinase family protein [Agrobacterium]|uniref:hydantoinase B/oxoprolinase family protein n=1 Tax=Agrobacterium TaxID=357 RepID=UPI001574D7D3|nr:MULTISPECIES: hydantoinase B/oxoprolinase family protein [Agrobacterium]NSX89034.1 hydantoinase B/oxoprolinase family protein [Agrobacterium tumefaciens]NSZ19690.1 hydantoinase B/oxoprolinase family protein [Agrobacterium vitis]QZO06917.1 hydantoinase B/oxoprolinase family protein [Agrobacterium vitis]UJL91459.1 hydantoinase B/oxoprolinase family protein [Agrobacterium vitis]
MSNTETLIDAERIADPIAMEVFTNRLLAIADEIANAMIRASFSSNIKERKDCSVALFSSDGRLIAQASHIPLHLGSLMGSVHAVLNRYPIEKIAAGDVFLCNDPYVAGGTHTPDISVITPVFHNGEIRYFTANIGHHSDVGGTVPGSIHGGATSIFEEGLRLPVMKLYRAGVLDEDLLSMISLNSRSPEERWLDIKVQAAANERGARLMLELTEALGAEQVTRSIDDVFAYTSARLRNRIAEMQDGTASFTSSIESDGLGDTPVKIQANVTVSGSKLSVDFDGSGPQARGAMNVAESALHASVYYVVKTLLDPGLLPNNGMFANIEITAPEGSIVNPAAPAAVGARSITCNKVVRALIGAFAQLLPPERAMAAGQDIVPVMVFAGTRRGRKDGYVYLESIGGGSGARHDVDGMDGVHVHVTNTSNLPIEPLETEYDLIVKEYALVNGSAGAGEHRGGMGIAREITAPNGNVIFTARSDGHREGAPGAGGGGSGRPARLVMTAANGDEKLLNPMIANLPLQPGDSVRLETPGGGGFGAPGLRKNSDLGRDLRDGRLSAAESEAQYGASKTAEARH